MIRLNRFDAAAKRRGALSADCGICRFSTVVRIPRRHEAIRWINQATPNDVFIGGCRPGNPNCPETVGPDFDFGNAPKLIMRQWFSVDNGKARHDWRYCL
jgi:hypothetical protein